MDWYVEVKGFANSMKKGNIHNQYMVIYDNLNQTYLYFVDLSLPFPETQTLINSNSLRPESL